MIEPILSPIVQVQKQKMKFLYTFLIILLTSYISIADSAYPEGPSYRIVKNEIDQKVPWHRAKVIFHVRSGAISKETTLMFGDNGWEKTIDLDDSKSFEFLVRPGKHQFMIYLNDQYREIITDSILFEVRHLVEIDLYFKSVHTNQLVKKPVIYLYPTKGMDVEVKLQPTGSLTYTYPKYNDSWKVHATPEGKIKVGKNEFHYLFWEAEQELSIQDLIQNGVYLPKMEVEAYLEKTLTEFGLNSYEKADFMTFWMPQILSCVEETIYLSFLYNEGCNIFAQIDVFPPPDEMGRIYLLWKPVANVKTTNFSKEYIPIPQLKRSGFTLIEWGGVQLTTD